MTFDARRELVIQLHNQGKSYTKIKEHFDSINISIPKSCIQRTIKNYHWEQAKEAKAKRVRVWRAPIKSL